MINVLNDRNPIRMPVQAVQRGVGSSSSNTSCEVLPLSSVYGFPADIVNFAAHKANFFMGEVVIPSCTD